MMGWAGAVSSFFTDSIGILLYFFLICTWEGGKKERSHMAVPGTAVFLAALPGVLFILDVPEFPILAVQVFLAASAGTWLYGIGRKKALFLAVEYAMAVSLWKFILCGTLGIILRMDALPGRGTWENLAGDWIICLLTGVLCFFLYKKRKEEQSARRILSRTAVAGLLLTVTLTEQSILPIGEEEMMVPLIFAMVLLMGMLVYYTQRQYEREKELAKLKSTQKELLERDYRRLNEIYAGNAKLFHDFHNHMTILGQFLREGRTEEASAYLEEIQGPVKRIAKTVWTGDETMDYLINSKLMAAKEKQIHMEANIEFPRQTGIRSADLCAVLGNLLDNALEAAGQAEDSGRRYIWLTIRRMNYMLIIKVKNTCEKQPLQEKGEWITKKEDKSLHGWGLKSAAAAVEKYNGTLLSGWEESVFTATAAMCFREQEEKGGSRS